MDYLNVEIGAPVLLVCRDGDFLKELHGRLTLAGYSNLHLARSAKAALEVIRTNNISMLVAFLDMGEIDGWRMTRLIRGGALECLPSIPILLLTEVWCQRIAEITAREYGVNRILSITELDSLEGEVGRCLAGQYEPGRKSKLLVIEDAPDTADLVKRVMERQYKVEIVNNGEDGIRRWQESRHQLILLDFMLPNKCGKEIAKEILEEEPHQAIVMMTAHSSSELAEEMVLLGVTDFLPKPFRTEQLRKVCELATKREDFMESNRQFEKQVLSLEESRSDYKKISDKHQQLLHNLQTVVMELDDGLEIRYLNYPWNVLMGYSIEESLGKNLKAYLTTESQNTYPELEEKLLAVLNGREDSCEPELCLKDKDGQRLWAKMRVRRSLVDEVPTLTVCLDNITKHKVAQKQLEYIAMHDSLTGLFNRRYFEESLKQLYADALRNKRSHAIVYIDLDHFKIINDSFGHREGDEVLRQISAAMSRRVRATDLLCRLGGDEFAILVHSIDEEGVTDIALDLQKIINDYTYEAEGHRVNLGCSIGLSIVDGLAGCAEEYLMQADIALYAAKARGRNVVHCYNPEDNDSDRLRSRINWAQQVRAAITEDRIILHFQPVQDVQLGEVAYYEALVRIRKADGSLIYPGSFIPALEKTGEMHLLDRWIIKLAIEQLRQNPVLKRIAINLSAYAFNDENLVPVIHEALTTCGVDPSALTFELTESASLFNLNVTKHVIEELHAIGCSFAVDDFGSGFSSFAYLKELPADYIKLDGSFIRRLHVDDVDKALVRSLIQVVKALGKKAVAEYVENAEILAILNEYGVDYVQGYYIGHPMPVEDVREFSAALAQDLQSRVKC
ncbi:EAL domain-containing protein [Teredinibacter franksiae]|uniref:EAL domain-containing protein n=1 Tax=Teredinibacter franksiae TaxID=2761453 RepID=UPI001629E69A|nr:EAL domain-containing protein [Teredinibacter franksiae]